MSTTWCQMAVELELTSLFGRFGDMLMSCELTGKASTKRAFFWRSGTMLAMITLALTKLNREPRLIAARQEGVH
jgi:hypothetical protein